MYESESDEEIDFASLVVSAPSPHPTPVVDHPKPLNPAPFAFNSEEEGDEDAFEPRSVHTQKTLFDPSNPRGEGVHVRLTPGAARGVGGGGRGAGRGVRTAPNPSVILNRKSLSDSVPPNASALRDSAASNGSVSGTPKTRAPLVLNAFASPSMATFQDQRDHQADTTTASLSKPRSSAFHRKEDAQKKPSDSHISAALTALSPFETMPEREQMADKSMQKNVLRAVKNAYALVVVLEEMIANSSVLNEDRAKNEDGVMLDIDERRSFAKLCASIIATSPSTAAKYNLEGRLWKTTFHSCIESLRSNPPALPSPSARASWASLIATGVQTLTRLVYLLAAKPVEDLARLSPPSTPTYSRMIAWLGDLARYRVALGVEGVQVFLANGEGHACLKSWHNARKMYHIAAFLSPGNGQYYNHLALFDLTASETLSSLHNYLRALNVKAPFTGAHDSVLALFAGNRQVYQEAAKEETVRQSRVAKRSARSGTNKRGKETAAGAEEDVEVLVVRVFEALYTRVR
ncbi:hypothetical protein BC830DRAFT_264600 [Chytriomyces sp. MP71]|nr:hypothetical protein BC830DRAFT_264600 [Chytriomyces sp. MP71]